ncbi:unnamed protein product [Calypogeia fissa]
MQMFRMLQLIVATLAALWCSALVDGDEAWRGSLPQMPFYHRFSAKAKENAEKTGADWVFPALNTPEYHKVLVHRDLVRHGRNLAVTPSSLAFFLGNLTTISTDGLYYALVNVGTPSVSYFVALDTGSDLFWLPCECKACAPPSSPYFEGLPSLNVYAPSKSTTSKAVTCSSSDCAVTFSTCQDQNLPSSGQCQYGLQYATANTSTSGTVYQDDIHLRPNDGASTDITLPIVLGCGQTQTGSLVDGTSVPDGLIGLGRMPYSVPSILAQSGLAEDSFSMCFSVDGSGRIVFGDFGSSAVTSTPLVDTNSTEYPHYSAGIDSIKVGNDSIRVNDVTLVDTGTTTTFFTSTVYQAVIKSFSAQVTNYKRVIFDQTYELCYQTSNPEVDVPLITIEFGAAAAFPVLSPFLPYFYQSNNSLAGFCLALLDGGSMNIFGANFMVGYNLVFNRQQLTLGFEQSDCYNTETSALGPAVSPVGAPTSPSAAPKSVPTNPGASPLESRGVPATPGPGSSRPHAAGQRISVPLFSLFLLVLPVNFFLY